MLLSLPSDLHAQNTLSAQLRCSAELYEGLFGRLCSVLLCYPAITKQHFGCCQTYKKLAASLQLALACVELVAAIDEHDSCC